MTPDGKRHVFLIDDNGVYRQIVRDLAHESGFIASTVSDIPKALERLQNEADSIDVVLVDQVLPSGDGLEFIRTIRSAPWGSPLPVVFVSGVKPSLDIREQLEHLEVGFFDKGKTLDTLIPTLEDLFDRLKKIGR